MGGDERSLFHANSIGSALSRLLVRSSRPSPCRLQTIAYQQLNEEQLGRVIAMAEKLLSGDTATLNRWNQESLAWRGKQRRK
jgi:hypothetical protein